ncbi:MAG: hypothetical protein JXB05_36330 [Myxococcaceae bacterium]|nr:hypothetical protein [Myxococcaceae bacterium]
MAPLDMVRASAVTIGPSLVLHLLWFTSVLATSLLALGPPRHRRLFQLRMLAGVGALTPWAYLLAIRRRLQSWGATRDEVCRRLPGDEVVPHAMSESTRAITIQAPVTAVWPWLVQLGYGRGGFYSYDFLDALAGVASFHGGSRRPLERIVPELQHLAVGDKTVRLAPWSDVAELEVAAIEPRRLLAFRMGPDVSCAYILEARGERTTRLLIRWRFNFDLRQWGSRLALQLIEVPHPLMERKQLLGIKARAERLARERQRRPQ